MTDEENPCKKGLTPECFKKYPKYAKKVFAYKLLQAVVGSPLSADLQKMLWRHLVQVPISWMSWEDFIIPDDIPLEEIISDDWTPDDPLPDELTINLNEIIPDGWKEGDELPDGVTIDIDDFFPDDWTPGDPLPDGMTMEPKTEIPDDWRVGDPLPDGMTIDIGELILDDWKVGDEIPDGITIDTEELFDDDWTTGDPLPEGVVINIDVVLPEVWTVGEDLPFGITVNPDFRIDVDMLETLGIYIEEGKTYKGLFGSGWDPTTELPSGSSWKPYKRDKAIIASAVPPLYLPVFEAGPVHRTQTTPVPVAEYWEPFNGPAINTKHKWGLHAVHNVCGAPTIVSGKLTFNCDNPTPLMGKYNQIDCNILDDWPGAVAPAGLTLRIKVSAHTSSDDDFGTVCLWVSNAAWSNYVALHFAALANFPLYSYDQDIGDNGGDEMVIDLSIYGITSIDYLIIQAGMDQGIHNGHADYAFDYIHFE